MCIHFLVPNTDGQKYDVISSENNSADNVYDQGLVHDMSMDEWSSSKN
jgi:hypothetical protein